MIATNHIAKRGLCFSAMLIALAVIIACTGCSTPRQHYYAGQGLDLATTYYALEVDGGFEEANPLADDMHDVVLLKLAGVAVIETMAHLYPSHADTLYMIGSVIGYGAGIHNIYEVNK